MNETMTDVTTGDYNVIMGEDEATIIHPERKTDEMVEQTNICQEEEELQDVADESKMSWNFVFGMIFLALILSINIWLYTRSGSQKPPVPYESRGRRVNA